MSPTKLPIGTFVRIEKRELQSIVDELRRSGYEVIGPTIKEEAIVYDQIDSIDELPIGYVDEQDGGHYRLKQDGRGAYFDYVVGPHSLKNFLFPPQATVLEGIRADGTWQMRPGPPPERPLAVIGPRSCDLHAVRMQDRIFLNDRFVDPAYQARREGLFVVAVNCRRAASTCFCHSMKTGPAASFGYDLLLTELDDHFVVEVGSERGSAVALAADWVPSTLDEIAEARDQSAELLRRMKQRSSQPREPGANGGPRERYLDTTDIRDLLLDNLEHPRWDQVAERCLACGNCTMVCPTCFCSSVHEVTDLTGDNVRRERSWESCFTDEHSFMTGGAVRSSTRARYRQWLTHKLATWHDQFDSSGCVGCGRCITWCPVAIDLTEEVAAIRGGQA
jgi:ferredoxin